MTDRDQLEAGDNDSQDTAAPQKLVRIATGVAGFDVITQGGFFRGAIYLFLARPGSGKTILANQICFEHVKRGGRAVVVTLLTESHSRMMTQLRTFDFFDAQQVGTSVSYVSGYQALEKDKLKGLLLLVQRVVRDHQATLLVIDGIVTMGSMAESELAMKKFIHELQVLVELMGCTTLLLTGPGASGGEYALRTMVDGLVELHMEPLGMESARTIEVTKFRGGPVLLGRHLFEITHAGITIHPRIESLGKPSEQVVSRSSDVSRIGIPAVDAMLGGGLRSGSISMILGSPGSGKTLLGLSFLSAGAEASEPGLYFGFSESTPSLLRKAEATGIGLIALQKKGVIELKWQSPLHAIADSLAEDLLTTIKARGVRRLFIDGLGGFRDTLVYGDRSKRFFAALFAELRALDVITVVSDDTHDLGNVELPEHELTALIDNIVFTRHLERGSRLEKLMSVLKLRDGTEESLVRKFSIEATGFIVSNGKSKDRNNSAKGRSSKKASSKRGK